MTRLLALWTLMRDSGPRPRVLGVSLALGVLLTGAVAVGLPATSTSAQVASQTAPDSAATTAPPTVPEPATPSIVSIDARSRTPDEIRRDRQSAIRATRMARIHQVRTRIVQVARKQIGDRYAAGRTGPDAFDCSGLTRFVYKTATGRDLPHHSRAQWAKVKRIKKSQAQPGDLVFFFKRGAHHVGIYIGNGKMIDAPGYGERVRVSPISGSWWGRTYSGMGRILPA